jgi:hydroxyacylglutathione hydrolase
MEKVARGLIRVGLDDIRGLLDGGMTAWSEAGLPVAVTPQVTAAELAALLGTADSPHVLDVREESEYQAGHIPGAVHIVGGELAARIGEVPNGSRPVAIVCRSGYRSTVAASVLERAGLGDVVNVAGGMEAWRRAGLPVREGEPA